MDFWIALLHKAFCDTFAPKFLKNKDPTIFYRLIEITHLTVFHSFITMQKIWSNGLNFTHCTLPSKFAFVFQRDTIAKNWWNWHIISTQHDPQGRAELLAPICNWIKLEKNKEPPNFIFELWRCGIPLWNHQKLPKWSKVHKP